MRYAMESRQARIEAPPTTQIAKLENGSMRIIGLAESKTIRAPVTKCCAETRKERDKKKTAMPALMLPRRASEARLERYASARRTTRLPSAGSARGTSAEGWIAGPGIIARTRAQRPRAKAGARPRSHWDPPRAAREWRCGHSPSRHAAAPPWRRRRAGAG